MESIDKKHLFLPRKFKEFKYHFPVCLNYSYLSKLSVVFLTRLIGFRFGRTEAFVVDITRSKRFINNVYNKRV